MRFLQYEEFTFSLRDLYQKGGKAECAAGLLPAPSDSRTDAQQQVGQCKLVCSMIGGTVGSACMAAGGATLLTSQIVGRSTAVGACTLVCK